MSPEISPLYFHQRIAKGAGGKGPRQKTSKIFKKCQKVFRHFSTIFAQGKKRQKSSKNVKKFFDTFRQFSRGTFFPAPFGGLRFQGLIVFVFFASWTSRPFPGRFFSWRLLVLLPLHRVSPFLSCQHCALQLSVPDVSRQCRCLQTSPEQLKATKDRKHKKSEFLSPGGSGVSR